MPTRFCPRCAYDLTTLPLDGNGDVACPECGLKVTTAGPKRQHVGIAPWLLIASAQVPPFVGLAQLLQASGSSEIYHLTVELPILLIVSLVISISGGEVLLLADRSTKSTYFAATMTSIAFNILIAAAALVIVIV
jgi:hypothetical protein